jgi:transcriptional regulator with XRE-family HTH domain
VFIQTVFEDLLGVKSHVGKTIRILREASGMSLTHLAEKAKVSKPFLSLVESGKRQPSLDVIRRIGKALKTPSEAIVLMGMGESATLFSKNNETKAIVRSVQRLLGMERKLSKLLRSEDDDQSVRKDSPR